MLARKDSPRQPQKARTKAARTTAAIAALIPPPPEHEDALVSRRDTDGPAERCAACGRPYAPFSLQTSGVLDLVLLAKDVLSDIQRCVEEAVLP
jgi:hypothetical protein